VTRAHGIPIDAGRGDLGATPSRGWYRRCQRPVGPLGPVGANVATNSPRRIRLAPRPNHTARLSTR
jgi:hypothetical protein